MYSHWAQLGFIAIDKETLDLKTLVKLSWSEIYKFNKISPI